MAEELLPIVFRKSPESIVTYPYQDLLQGVGMANFYGVRMIVSGGASTYLLIESQFDAGTYSTGTIDVYSSGFTKDPNTTITMDTNEFKISKILKGIPYAIIPISAATYSTTDSSVTVSNVKLMRVAVGGGATALTNEFDLDTLLNEATGPTLLNASKVVIFNEIAATKILVGEKIRLSFDITGTNSWALLHNPSGDSVPVIYMTGGTATKTQLVVSLPFEIDI